MQPSSKAESWYTEQGCSVEELKALTAREVNVGEFRFAAAVEKKIPIYHCPSLLSKLSDQRFKQDLMCEWIQVLQHGPGVLVLKGAYADTCTVDDATRVFKEMVLDQRAEGGDKGDHFAKKGANDRIWNLQEKFCVRAPEVFARYFTNPFVAAISEAWLGPGYQMTSQLNVIRPGGEAQTPHRDFHLGFQSSERAAQYPAHVHIGVAPRLSLQGAVAHVECPVEAGPTKLLPFSQLYPAGYVAWRRPDFRQHFEDNFVQLPLSKGDCLFLNPALLHAGGANVTSGGGSIDRMVNLLQVNSGLARAMESVNREKMSNSLYPILLRLSTGDEQHRLQHRAVECAVAACAEGYPFPTNLDLDTPAEGEAAPQSQQELFFRALREQWSPETFQDALSAMSSRHKPTSKL